MSFAVWTTPPPFAFSADDREQIYRVGSVWVVTDDPARATQAAVDAQAAIKAPDVAGFINDVKAAMGGIVASNGLAKQYPLFYPALETAQFADVQALVIDAHSTGVLSDAAYATFKKFAAARNIPITLP